MLHALQLCYQANLSTTPPSSCNRMTGKSEQTTARDGERIAKAIARAGLASRREAEAWIGAGRVAVNGKVITSPALNITLQDRVSVDGKPLPTRERTRLFLYNKPRGLVTTHADPQGRPTIFGALPRHLPRLLSVGRLDINTEGLLLLTNDGGLARVLELPQTGWLRRYRVRALGRVTQAQLDGLRNGITIDGIRYGAIEATLDREQPSNVWLTFAIREGKNREVRNVMGHLGLTVSRLIRVSFGPFQLGELAAGTIEEVKSRTLREQLGDKLIARAGADFSGPVAERDTRPATADDPHSTSSQPQPSVTEWGQPRNRRPRSDESQSDGKGGDDAERRSPRRSGKPQHRSKRRDRSGGPRPSRPR